MQYYFAPLESVTGYIYRNAHKKFFNGVDKYFTPFISPNSKRSLKSREKKDILPEHNENITVVPQILTNNPDFFVDSSKDLEQFGYTEVNLNLGCPSGTVVSKGKGSGFLAKPEELERFLEQIFSNTPIRISIKTRIGKERPEEFVRLMEIFNQFSMEELIIHPRTQLDYYKNNPNLEVFNEALKKSKNTICYNGDLFTISDVEQFSDLFPAVDKLMIGRGLIANPAFVQQLRGGIGLKKDILLAFHNQIFVGYQETLSGSVPVLHKMKELWFYMGAMFDADEKALKKIRKSQSLENYEYAVNELFYEHSLIENARFSAK